MKVIREWAVKDDGGVDEGKLVLGRYEESEGGVLRLEMLSSSKGFFFFFFFFFFLFEIGWENSFFFLLSKLFCFLFFIREWSF